MGLAVEGPPRTAWPGWAPRASLVAVGVALAVVALALRPAAPIESVWGSDASYAGTAPAQGADVHRVDARVPGSQARGGLALEVGSVQLAVTPVGQPGAPPFRIQLAKDGQLLADRVLTPGDPAGLAHGPATARGASGSYELRVLSLGNGSVPYALVLTTTFAFAARAEGAILPQAGLLALAAVAVVLGALSTRRA